MAKMLEDKPDFVKKTGNAWRDHLAKIVPVMVPQTVVEALSPKFLEKVNEWIVAGKQSAEIIRMLGLTWDDARWLAIKREVSKQAIPDNEMDALIKSYQDQEELFDRMGDLLNDIDAKINENPLNDEDRKAQHHFYKYKMDLLKEMLSHRSSKFTQFMDVKRLNKTANNLNVQILIQNNIPRPEKVEQIEKVVKEIKK